MVWSVAAYSHMSIPVRMLKKAHHVDALEILDGNDAFSDCAPSGESELLDFSAFVLRCPMMPLPRRKMRAKIAAVTSRVQYSILT